MGRYLDLVLKNPKKMIFFIAVLTLLLGSGLPKIEFDSSVDSIMPRSDPEYILNEKIKEKYGNTGNFIIICVSTDNALDPDFLFSVNNLHIDIEEYESPDLSMENSRLELLKKAEADSPLSTDHLLSMFSHDPVFQRYLKRRFNDFGKDIRMITPEKIGYIIEKSTITKEIKSRYLIDAIGSPFTAKDLIGRDDTLISYDLIERDDYGKRIIPRTEEELARFETRLRNNPAFENGIYVTDDTGEIITDIGIMLKLNESSDFELLVTEIIDITSDYELDITLQGLPVVNHIINDYLQRDLKKFLPLVFLVVIIIFYLNFRSVRGVVLPFVTLVLADVWIVGLMGHLGFKLTVVGISLPSLMAAVGSSYSIHILNQYYMEYENINKLGLFKGLRSAMSHITVTVMLAGITTFFGFFMLVTNQVSSIREMGVFSAIGVLFAVFISVTLIPSVLILLGLDTLSEKKNLFSKLNPVERITSFFSGLALDHGKSVIIVLSAILTVSFIGLTNIKVGSSVYEYFKEDDPILKSSKLIGEKFGGITGINILIDSGEDYGARAPEFLKFIEELREWLVAEENIDLNVGRTDTFTDFIKTMHLAMHDNNFEYYKIPEERIDIESYITIYPGRDSRDTGIPDDFESYVDWRYRTVNIIARIWEKEGVFISTGIMDHIIKRIDLHLEENIPENYSYQISGEPKILVRLAQYIVSGQIMSLFFSLCVVSFIIFLLFRNWRAAAVSLIPITTAVIFNFGLMGFTGIRLDLTTAIIASIAIGIGIDDTIHFLNTYRHFNARGFSKRDSINNTLKITGKAIIYTSLALTFGFMVLTVSTFKPLIYFGILVASTMIATTIGALLFLPAVMNTFDIDLSPSDNSSIFWRYFDLSRFLDSDSSPEEQDSPFNKEL